MTSQERLEELRQSIILDYPEFAPLITPLPFERVDSLPTMGTNGKRIVYNEEWVAQQSDELLATVIMHEGGHCGLLHCTKRRVEGLIGADPTPEQQRKANVAMDLVVNPILLAAGRNLGPNWLYDPQYEGMMLEEVFNMLPENPQQNSIDWHGVMEVSEGGKEEQEQREAQWKQAFADFLTLAKARGTLPGDMLDKLSQVLKPEIPWDEILSNLVSVICGREDYTWKRPSRRGLAIDLYLPSGIDSAVESLCFLSDTSGSMSDEDCSKAVRATVLAAELCKIKKFWWIEGDAAVQRVLEFEGMFDPPRDMKGRGGTDFRPLIEEALKYDPACIIYFTDLEGTFPTQKPTVPVIWVTRKPQGQAPWGQVVRIK